MVNSSASMLGDFLRSRRSRLAPADVGLVDGRRRRIPGLRREEVAERAGIGIDWYIRLEQGRAVTPSTTTIDALARALNLDSQEHAHLRELGKPPRREPFVREIVPASIKRLIDRLEFPAYVTGRRWDVLAWNGAAAELLVDFGGLKVADRNILLHMLTSPDAKALFGKSWAAEAKRMVALFRTTHDRFADDPAFRELVARLRSDCPEFCGWWARHDVRASGGSRKLLSPRDRPSVEVEFTTFQTNENPGLQVTLLIAN